MITSTTTTMNIRTTPASWAGSERPAEPLSAPRQSGFTLVELMVAMTISLVVLAGVIQVFVSNKQTHRSQQANARLQESGRTAIALLQRDIRPVGFQGCRSARSIPSPRVVANAPIPIFDADHLIRGYQATSSSAWSPSLPSTVPTAAINGFATNPDGEDPGVVNGGTDVITVQGSNGCSDISLNAMSSLTTEIRITLANSCNFATGDIIMVADCSSADIFRATLGNFSLGLTGATARTLIHNTSNNTSASLSKRYSGDSEIIGLHSYTYYVAPGTDGGSSLWRFDNTVAPSASNPMEVVAGIADLQIEYGQDSSGNQVANSYVPADDVSNWPSVISLRISILVESADDNITPQSQTYIRAGVTVTNKRLHRVFTTTIQLRNQVS